MNLRAAMMCALASFVPVIASSQETPKAPEARIVGRVTAADTGKPIRGATIRMVSQQGRQAAATTDADGRFQFVALTAGTYTLEARAERYVPMDLGGRPNSGLSAVARKPVIVRDGELFEKADFRLPRGGAIEGRLVDEFGDPAPGLMVQVSQVVFAGARRRLMPVGNQAAALLTDDRGHFRIHGLAPGTYYVSVLSGVFAEQAESGGFAPTYYPGTTRIADARPLLVGPGQEITNLTIPLTPARMSRITGRAVDDAGAPIPNAALTLSTADNEGLAELFITRAAAESDGTFVLRNVPPGQFTLQGYGKPPAGGPQNLNAGAFGWLRLNVAGEDQAGLIIKIAPGPSLRGRIVAEDPGAAFNPRDVQVSALPVQFDSAPVGGGPPPYEVQPDGAFEVKNMSGVRLVRVSVRNPGWTLKRITRQGRDITDETIDFTKGEVGDVEVVMTSRVTSVSGSVTDDKGQPVTDYTVIIFASDSAKWTDRSRFIAQARPSQSGQFTIRGLPPDDYYAVAVPGAIGTEWQDPEFLKPLRQRATGLLLADGESRTLTLSLAER